MQAEAPLVSIVVPTFARPKILRGCLDGIAALEFDHDRFELIIVDDGAPAGVADVVAGFRQRLRVRLVSQKHAGPGAARNAGAALALGSYLVFLDDDCVPAPDWLATFVRALSPDDRRLLGGRVENALHDNPFSEASDRIGRFVYEYYLGDDAREKFFSTSNLALSAELFRSLGGFDTSIPSATAEDKEFCDRWRGLGLALAHVPNALVYHSHALGLGGFLRQHFNYGRGILSFRLLKRRRGPSRVIPEPWKFYVQLVLSPLRTPYPKRRWLLSGLIVLAQLATVVGAARQALAELFRWGPRQPREVKA